MVTILRRMAAACTVLAVALLAASGPAQARSAVVQLELFKAGFIVGVEGGSGFMEYGPRTYQLAVGGVSLGLTIGASRAYLEGRARNLRRPSDIEGTYTAFGAGGAILTAGEKSITMRNQKGVVLELSGPQIGLEFAIDLNGLQIRLK